MTTTTIIMMMTMIMMMMKSIKSRRNSLQSVSIDESGCSTSRIKANAERKPWLTAIMPVLESSNNFAIRQLLRAMAT